MLSGRVLLTSEIAGIAPHVRDSKCGVVVDANELSIYNGISKLLSLREKWKEMGLQGRRYVMENLQWKKIASNILQEYKKLN
jgi:glycosyltransferase involved in cell wall biosynthesis